MSDGSSTKDSSKARADLASLVSQSCCIQILGMHRSGTSMIARIMNLLGVSLPANLMGGGAGNKVGHWESKRLVKYNDKILKQLGSRWDDWRPIDKSALPTQAKLNIKTDYRSILDDEYGEASLFSVKDPRLCRFNSLFSDALSESDVQLKIVFTIRNPLEVCDSLETRNGMDRDNAALLWLRHILDAELSSRDQLRTFINYSELMSDWQTVINKTAVALAIEWPTPLSDVEDEISTFIDPDLKHHTRSTEEILLDPVLRTWVGGAYEALLLLAHKPHSKPAMESLDRIRDAFNVAAPTLYAIKQRGETQLQSELAPKDAQINELTQTITRIKANNARLLKLANQNETDASDLLEKNKVLENEIIALRVKIAATDASSVPLADQYVEKIETLDQRLTQKDVSDVHLQTALSDTAKQISKLQEDVQRLQGKTTRSTKK
jgi:hypothetical protein